MKAINIIPALLLNLFCVEQVFGQCIAFAGNDTVMCAGPDHVLNGASASGGTPPYTYAWIGRQGFFDPEHYMEDPTKLHPTVVVYSFNLPINYFLVVTDAAGDTCRDTITVMYSYPSTHLSSSVNYISAGDSVALNVDVNNNFPPFTYHWEPSTSLSNPNISNPISFPSVTTTYTVTVTDSLGCVKTDSLTILVEAVGITAFNGESQFDLFPNPTENESWLITNYAADLEVSVFDLQGRRIDSSSFSGGEKLLDTKDLVQGIYFVIVRQGGRIIGTRKLIKT